MKPHNNELNLTDIDWPICLLEFSKTFDELQSGCELVVLVKDQDVVRTIERIVLNSSNQLVNVIEEPDQYRVFICKR